MYGSLMTFRATRTYLDQFGRRFRAMPRRFRLEPGILIFALISISIFIVIQSRRAALTEVEVAASNMTALLGDQTRMALKATDLALQSLVARLESETFVPVSYTHLTLPTI